NEAVIDEIAPTHQTDGKRTYRVSVTGPDGKTYQDKKEITLPALIYNFEFTEFRWDDDYTKADAVYTDEESGETRVITVNSTEATVQATCTEDGSITYTVFISAMESLDKKEHGDTRTVPLYAIGHSWGEITYSWSEDCSQATASVHCLNDDTHVISETVKTSSEITGKPTCTEMGETTYTAAFTNKMFTSQEKAVVNIPATGHKEGDKVIENEIEPNCTKDGSYDIVIYCSECGEQLSRETVKVNPQGHKAGEKHRENEVAATCTSAGSYDEVVRCTVCNEIITSEHVVVKATGHNYDKWQYDGEAAKTHTHVCANDPDHKETEPCSFDEGVVNGNVTTYTCRECGGKYTVTASEEPEIEGIVRVAGDNRYQTAESITDFIMEAKAEEKLEAIVLACGGKFADALSGSYLAAVNDCPIMLIDDRNASEVEAYLRTVMNPEGKVYILGGTAAVSSEIEKEIRKTVKNVIRLAGDTRYSTNLEILKDSTLTSDVILVATGKDFADSLSASATGLPLLLVKDALDDVQKSYLKDIRDRKFIILGGEKAVSSDIEKRLKAYGSVERIAGADRFETSVRIAEKLFTAPKCAVLAFSNDFPDGLCGGPLAQMLKAPVILTRPDKASIA
ncbi:MAG: cell wall-binding repeat-containing protein, partial [Erysipelotrichaceae bacterium]|nr:cell wall-binding repeat-containing protein [Erysipelotrichaceae bacterium]